jgi:hypothetical protein
MTTNVQRWGGAHQLTRHIIAIVCAMLLVPGDPLFARQAQQPVQSTARIPSDQLDALVAPIAVYPDELLSQTLVASTYPLEIIQLYQWLQRNKNLKDKALVDAVSKQPWDPSIKAMASLPDLVKRLADDIQWTTDLGNAFLAQQGDVMDAVQRMRVKAQSKGALTSNEYQTVQTEVVDNKSVIVVEQANPQVVYVPSYDPVAVYGSPIYPYPSIYYPPYTPGAVWAASAISFGAGVAMGAAWGGGWGWGVGWGNNDIDINVDNTFNRSSNIDRSRTNRSGRTTWQHNPQHRGGAPYADRATANRFGSNARGDSLASRQRGAQQQISRQKGSLPSVGEGRIGGARPGEGISAGGSRSFGAGPAASARSSGDRIGNRSVGGGHSMGTRGGFGGGSGGFSGSSARSSSMRGSSSFGGSRGSFGGGGFGGGGRSFGGGGRGFGGGGRRR